jgi:hypothetical protein
VRAGFADSEGSTEGSTKGSKWRVPTALPYLETNARIQKAARLAARGPTSEGLDGEGQWRRASTARASAAEANLGARWRRKPGECGQVLQPKPFFFGNFSPRSQP